MNKKIIGQSLVQAAGTFAYIFLIAWFFFNGEKWFGNKPDNFFMPLLMLLLLVVSATITGGLVLGRPLLMYLDGEKKTAVKLLFATLGWLVLLIAIVLVILFVK